MKEELEASKFDNAASVAEDLLKQATCCNGTWNYGNAVHISHIALGSFALLSGDVDTAKIQLLEAGKTPGSPQLNSFGPDWNLANKLLKLGEKDVVLKYLELCSKFWKDADTGEPAKALAFWAAEIRNGHTPDLMDYVDL